MSNKKKNKEIRTLKFEDELETTIPFSIQKVDDNLSQDHINFREPHRHNFHIICFLKNGKGEATHTVDFVNYKAHLNSVYFIRANQVHVFKKVKASKLDVMVITFPNEFLMQAEFPVLDDSENVNELNLNTEDFDYLYDLLLKIQKEFHTSNKWRGEIIRNYVNIILSHLSRIYLDKKKKKSSDIIDDSLLIKYKKLLNEKFLELRQISDYSGQLFVTPGHLNDKIKELTGKTAKELLNERIILEAKRLLFYDNSSIKEIANNLNFWDTAYFTRFFKKQTELTPQEFRQKIRELS
jgi:AraC family transcriptional regulator, transcriptional activator of pobA